MRCTDGTGADEDNAGCSGEESGSASTSGIARGLEWRGWSGEGPGEGARGLAEWGEGEAEAAVGGEGDVAECSGGDEEAARADGRSPSGLLLAPLSYGVMVTCEL